MSGITLPSKPDELEAWLQEHAPHLLPALAEADDNDADDASQFPPKGKKRVKSDPPVAEGGVTADDVRRIVAESRSGEPTVEEFEERLREATQATIEERDAQRELSRVAERLIESAEGVPPRWKGDLKARYAMLPSGAPAALLIESAEQDEAGAELTERQIIERRVEADLDHVRDLIAEATGKPRVRGEGGAKRGATGDESRGRRAETSHWRREFKALGLAESEDDALSVFGVRKVEG